MIVPIFFQIFFDLRDPFSKDFSRSMLSGELFQKKSVEKQSWQSALKSKIALALCKPIARKAQCSFLFLKNI